jgi:hypothetical protein
MTIHGRRGGDMSNLSHVLGKDDDAAFVSVLLSLTCILTTTH